MQFESLKKLFHTIESALRPHPGFYSSKEKIKKWLDSMEISNYKINDDLTVDVNGSVQIGGKNIHYLPVKFGHIKGWFACSSNPLRTLKGSPDKVDKYFIVDSTQITNLEHSPRYIGDFMGIDNCPHLTSLIGFPTELQGNIKANFSPIKSFKGCPNSINGDMSFINCQISSLEYIPKKIKGYLDLRNDKDIAFKNSNSELLQNNINNLKELAGSEFHKVILGNSQIKGMPEKEIAVLVDDVSGNHPYYEINHKRLSRFYFQEYLSQDLKEKIEPSSKKLKL